MKPDLNGLKFGPYWLTPGISRLNACTFFFSSFMFVTLVTFLNFVQPYLLEEILKVPADIQGSVTGMLNFVHEGVALIVMGLIGSVSDRTGRRPILLVGLTIWIVGLILYPLADSIMQLYIFRIITAVGVGVASVMVIATMLDYPQEVSRGKWGGTNSFITSFAILTVLLVFSRLPNIFVDAGFDPVHAGRYTFWVGAGVTLFAAIIIRIGYFSGRLENSGQSLSPFAGLSAGIRAVKGNPRLALAYGTAFAARGDLVVISAFLSLWFVRAGAEQGISTADAIVQAGISTSPLIVANWIWAPVFGIILDRINRVTGLCIAMTLAAIGYFAIGLVDNPYNMSVMMTATFVLGIGEISAVIAGNVLIGQEAPPNIRGACVGVFGLIGTLGILSATYFGGQVFDKFNYSAPFTMMAGVNAAIALWALTVIIRAVHKPVAAAG